MASFLFGAAGFLLTTVALGLVAILRRPAEVDHMMAAQLLGTGGVADTSFAGRGDRGHRRSWTSHCCWRCSLRSRPSRSSEARPTESEVTRSNERRMKLAFDIFTVFAVSAGCVLLFGGDGRFAPLPGFADASARPDQGGQSWPRPCRSGPVATGERAVRRA